MKGWEGIMNNCVHQRKRPAVTDLYRLVRCELVTDGAWWRVGGGGGRRSGETGLAVGILSLRHAGGYEIVLQFADGKVDSFQPLNLFVVIRDQDGKS